MTRRALALLAVPVVAAALIPLGSSGPVLADEANDNVVAAPVAHDKFVKAVRLYRREQAEARALRRTLRHRPDFEVSLQLAGIAYGQDWRHLLRCALSEGARNAERFQRHNRRPNSQGSGAFSSFQFMRGTFLSTPYARLDWTRQDVQAFAAAWMWANGRRGEWAGVGC